MLLSSPFVNRSDQSEWSFDVSSIAACTLSVLHSIVIYSKLRQVCGEGSSTTKMQTSKIRSNFLFYYRCPLQFYIATTVHRDYLHFARNIYAEKKSCLNMSLHFL